MRKSITLLTAIAAIGLASPAAHASASEGVERTGDTSMSCEALSQEMQQLQEAEQRRARRKESGRRMMSFAGAALTAAAPSLIARSGGAGEVAVAQTLAGALHQGGAFQASPEAEPPQSESPEAQRLARVEELFAQAGC